MKMEDERLSDKEVKRLASVEVCVFSQPRVNVSRQEEGRSRKCDEAEGRMKK